MQPYLNMYLPFGAEQADPGTLSRPRNAIPTGGPSETARNEKTGEEAQDTDRQRVRGMQPV